MASQGRYDDGGEREPMAAEVGGVSRCRTLSLTHLTLSLPRIATLAVKINRRARVARKPFVWRVKELAKIQIIIIVIYAMFRGNYLS